MCRVAGRWPRFWREWTPWKAADGLQIRYCVRCNWHEERTY